MSADIIAETSFSLTKPVVQLVRQAVFDFDLIEPGDRIAVGMSGGKDSFMLAIALRELSRHGDLDFHFQPIHLDQNQPGFDRETFERALSTLELDCTVIDRDTHSVVQSELQPGQIPCSLCSRLRRGILNDFCRTHGFDKLALGHHLDDAVETFFLNLFFGRRLEPLKPLTPTDDGTVATIRPLLLVEERKIEGWVSDHGVPTVDCPVCDSFPESRRRDLKQLLADFSAVHGEVHASVRQALYEDDDARQLIEPR
jgi:tRNA 2-thiocytidine biosynthesis protein TtcA